MLNVIKKIIILFLKLFFSFVLKDSYDKDLNKTIQLYIKDDFTSLFSKIRIWDTPFVEVERLLPKKGLLLDLGCGDGIFTNYLAIKSSQRKIIGIELNKDRLKDAKKQIKNTKFIQGNVLDIKFPKSDAILMFHLLHHLPDYKLQDELIKKCHSSLKKGGKLVIVEVDNKPIMKYVFSHLIDKIIVPILFDKRFYDFKINYRNKDNWLKVLANFKVRVYKADRGKPFSHIILNGIKR